MTPSEKQSYQQGERRPIAARELSWSKAIAQKLAGWGVSANTISVIGMIFGCLAGGLLAATAYVPEGSAAAVVLWVSASILILSRLLANMFDGMVAVAMHTASSLGELYNEVPDRVSDTAILIGAGYALGGSPIWGYAAATAAMFTAYIRAMGKGAGARQEFCGPMAKQQRMFLVIIASLAMIALPEKPLLTWTLIVITAGSLATALRRLARVAVQLRGAV